MAAPLKNVHKCSAANIINLCRLHHRSISCSHAKAKSLALGVYAPAQKDGDVIMTPATKHFDAVSGGNLSRLIKLNSKSLGKRTGNALYYDVIPNYLSTLVFCIGQQGQGYDENEEMDKGVDNLRHFGARAVTMLRGRDPDIEFDSCGNAEAVAEGAYLSSYSYDELRSENFRKKPVKLSLCETSQSNRDTAMKLWRQGSIKARGQNWARLLMDMPSNRLTPTIFAEKVVEEFKNKDVTVNVRDKTWIEGEKMGAFLSVAQGSAEPPVFLHLVYKHPDAAEAKPIALVGKGVTFDTGGISLKPSASMEEMRGDMGGAACVVGALKAVADLRLPVHVHAFIPLTENMPGGKAIKPGDVVFARNGQSIQIDNTDAEGRLILADALNYAETVDPLLILDMATLTGAIDVALGTGASGAFSTSSKLYSVLQESGARTGDRVWRMPLFAHYRKQIIKAPLADLNNVGKGGRSGGSCTAAAFLRSFVSNKNWIHLDIAGVMSQKSGEDGYQSYLGSGMTGRPTRTIVEFIERVGKLKE